MPQQSHDNHFRVNTNQSRRDVEKCRKFFTDLFGGVDVKSLSSRYWIPSRKGYFKRIKVIAFAVVFSSFTKGRSKLLFRNSKMFSSQNIGEYGCVGSHRSRG